MHSHHLLYDNYPSLIVVVDDDHMTIDDEDDDDDETLGVNFVVHHVDDGDSVVDGIKAMVDESVVVVGDE